MRNPIKIILAVSLYGTPLLASADNLEFTGNLIKGPACIIQNGKPISVQFKDIPIDSIDGINNTAIINYELDCSEASNSAMRLQIRGDTAAWDNKALHIPGFYNLGIKIFMGGEWFPVNTWRNFEAGSAAPSLKASIYKPGPNEVATGSFKAVATLVIENQ